MNLLKNMFSLLLYLIDDQYECQLTQLDHNDIDKDEFLVERKRLQHFINIATSHGETNAWKEDPLKLLQFINPLSAHDVYIRHSQTLSQCV